MYRIENLLYLIRGEEVLLIRKKRGLGKGLFNGVGGKVREDESVEEAVVRECVEEVGVKPLELNFAGLLEFINNDVEKVFVHVFTCRRWKGTPVESDEAEPYWFRIDSLPFDNMWEDDRYWLPLVLQGKKVYGRFFFKKWRLEKYEVFVLNPVR